MAKKHIKRAYGIVLSAVMILAGICLMIACYGIYRSGDQPYSRESVAAAFSQIAFPVYLCLVLMIGGFILALIIPDEIKKVKPGRQTVLILQRLHEKTDLSQCDASIRNAIAMQQKRRRRGRLITTAALALGSVVFLIHALNLGHFTTEDINGSVVGAVSLLLPCMAVPFACAVFTVYDSKASMEKEIALLKDAHAPVQVPAAPVSAQRRSPVPAIRCCLLILGAVMLLYGCFTGGTADVLTKAINICTECVGLG